MTAQVVTYKGRPVTELTRDELIEAYSVAVSMLEANRTFQREADQLERLFASIRQQRTALTDRVAMLAKTERLMKP